jgi:DNA cross-link repair 1A protein
MFRNPRENAAPNIAISIPPSTGRPPTPPNGPKAAQTSKSMMTTRTSSSKALTPKPNVNGKQSTITSAFSKKPSAGKTPSKVAFKNPSRGNTSILSFFKKVDNPNLDDPLFLHQDSPIYGQGLGLENGNVTVNRRGVRRDSVDFEDIYGVDDAFGDGVDEERFNERSGSIKRRKLSTSMAIAIDEDGSLFGDDADENDAEADSVEQDDVQAAITCTPPPPDATAEKPKAKRRRMGAFVETDSDSDSESGDDSILGRGRRPSDQKNKFTQTAVVDGKALEANMLAEKKGYVDGFVATSAVEQDHIEENRPMVPEVDYFVPASPGRISPNPISNTGDKPKVSQLQNRSTSGHSSPALSLYRTLTKEEGGLSGPLSLKRDSASYTEYGFDDIEDFPDPDDEFADGEEYAERKWMEEQARLEAAEKGEEFPGDTFGNLNPNIDGDGEMTATCPICEVNLSGISADDASRHVNGCLDGNPIPIPLSIRNEPTETKSMPTGSLGRFSKAAIAKPGQANPFDFGDGSSEGGTAFTKLMSSKAEDIAWANAAAAENSSKGKPAHKRTCPFYKIMPGFFICVDAFRYGAVQGCNAYFLSHFHSDHYIGLTSTWCHGPIYCSKVTANLVKQQLRVDPKWVVALDFENKSEVPGTQGVSVHMIPANHCPGSSLFLFEKVIGKGTNPRIQRVLHCGDFRACPAHIAHPQLMPDIIDSLSGKTKQQKIDVCYLDTTYLNPRYAFPCQEDVITACADMCVSLAKERAEEGDAWETVKKERAGAGMASFVATPVIKAEDESIAMSIASENDNKARGRLLVICGTYSIGKERICMGIARALDCKIWAPPGKQRICAALEDPELSSRLTDNPREAQIHMQMLMEIRAETLQDYLNSYKPHFSRVVGFRPSGWNYRPPSSRFVESPSIQTVLHGANWRSSYGMKELVPQRGSTREASCFGVPYSEHSSFRELTMFCMALRIEKVIPTVNVGSAPGRAKMKAWIERWMAERRKHGVVKIGDGDGDVRW